MKKLMFMLVILGMAGAADASYKWTGYAGDHLWSSGNNWDNLTPPPSTESWVVNKAGFPIGNHAIVVNQSTSTQTGAFYTQAGYKCSLTIQSGVTMNMSTFNGDAACLGNTVDVVVQSGANWNVSVGDAKLNINSNESVSTYGNILADYMYINNNNAQLHVYNYAETWELTRVASDPGCGVFVYAGANFKVTRPAKPPTYNGGYQGWDKKLGKVFIMLDGMAQFRFDCSTDYLNYVAAGETGGTWEVDYGTTLAGYTTIKYLPEPASLMLLVLGSLALIRRR